MKPSDEIRKYITETQENAKKLLNESRQGEVATFNGNEIKIATYFLSEPNDKAFIEKNIDKIWNILQEGYQNLGGFKTYNSKEHLLKKSSWIKIGFLNGEIVAVDVFNDYLGGQKSVGISCVKGENHDAGIQLIKMIISENIHNINDYTWAEVSGRIEDFYRENGGLNIKAEYAPLYLGKTVSILTDDEYHYTRLIGQKPLVKTIYGIKDKNIIDQMIDEDAKSVRDFIHENETGFVNEEYDFYKYYKTKERWENAKVIVDGLYDLYENYFYYEFPEDLYKALFKYFSIIEEDLNEGNITEDMIRRMKECVERCHELMENVTQYKTFKI